MRTKTTTKATKQKRQSGRKAGKLEALVIAAEEKEPSYVEIDGANIITVLQFSDPNPLPTSSPDDFVAQLVVDALGRRSPPKRGSTFFLGLDRPHVTGQSNWLGVDGASAAIVDALAARLRECGCRVSVERAVVAHHGLRPLLAVSATEVVVPMSSVLDTEALGELGALPVVRRRFVIQLSNLYARDQQQSLLLANGPYAAKPLPYFRDDEAATFVFQRVTMRMLGVFDDGSITLMAKYGGSPPTVLGFDVSVDVLEQLMRSVSDDGRDVLFGELTEKDGQRTGPLPPGAVIVGVRARLTEYDGKGSMSFVTREFFKASDTAAMRVEF